MTHVLGSDRRLTAYRYVNSHVSVRYREGIMYHDSETDMIVYQCADKVTLWHGEMKVQPFGLLDHLVVRFDATYDGSRRPPRLRSSVLFTSFPETYEGYDYRGRFVQMVPIKQWTLDTDAGTWKYYAEWSTDTHQWVVVVDPEPENEPLSSMSSMD